MTVVVDIKCKAPVVRIQAWCSEWYEVTMGTSFDDANMRTLRLFVTHMDIKRDGEPVPPECRSYYKTAKARLKPTATVDTTITASAASHAALVEQGFWQNLTRSKHF